MPIIDLQRRLRQIGRIRAGQQVTTSGGKRRPAKLETFRLTSQDKSVVEAAAELLGGKVAEWPGAPVGEQWEVVTEASSIPVIVPPAPIAHSAWYELWSGGGCQRRCDGVTEVLTDQPCLCAAEDERQCRPHTRLSVMLADLPGVGVWRLDTQGWYAASELAGIVDILSSAAGRGQLLPAVLKLEQREVRRPGEPVRRFGVPVLDVALTPAALGLVTGGPSELPAAGVEGSWQPIDPGPEEPVDIGRARDPQTPEPVRRKNSPPEIPPTGLKPRGDLGDPEAEPEPEERTLSGQQMRKMRALYTVCGVKGATLQKQVGAVLLGVDKIGSHANLTPAEATKLIDELEVLKAKIEKGEVVVEVGSDGAIAFKVVAE